MLIAKDDFEGFAAPKEFGHPHYRVEIPQDTKKPIRVIEDFGLLEFRESEELRGEVDQKVWAKIAKEIATDFNGRIKARKLRKGKWKIGSVKMDRLLGKELCVLVWALEFSSSARVDKALKNWKALRSEERWWLFTMTGGAGAKSTNSSHKWRIALRAAIGENIPLAKKKES